MTDLLLSAAGPSAYAAAAATVLSFAALFIFFAIGGVFGPINDAASVFQMVFLIPVALALHGMHAGFAPRLSATLTASAILAMIAIAVLQSLLLLGRVRYEQSLNAVLLMGGVLGVWWLVGGILSLVSAALPPGLGWVSVLAGLSGVALVAGFWLGGQTHPLAAAGFVANAVLVPIWAVWLGRILLRAAE